MLCRASVESRHVDDFLVDNRSNTIADPFMHNGSSTGEKAMLNYLDQRNKDPKPFV